MKDTALLLAAVSLVAGCVVSGDAQQDDTSNQDSALDAIKPGTEPPMLGIQWAKSQSSTSHGQSPLLVWHDGEIMTSAHVEPIFWGPSWSNTSFVGDKISGLQAFYGGLSGSAYDKSNTEYTGTNGTVGSSVTVGASHVDLSASPTRAPKVSAIQAEVCKEIASPVANGYYPVYTDLPRGHAGYCAWHSYGTCQGVPVQFGFFFNLDNDAGCDPQDTSGLHSQGLAALANVSGHEISEAQTDPRNGGWWDSSGEENADKCAWSFSGKLVKLGNTSWKVQGNWSNAAFLAGSGYPTRSGELGCLDGT